MDRRDFFRALAAFFATACTDALSPRASAQRTTRLTSGPWKGVYDTSDPFDASPSHLRDLLNGYIPDPQVGSGAYARNGFCLSNNGTALTTGVGAQYGQGVYQHTMLDGTILNFVVIDGKLLRITSPNVAGGAASITNVSPVGISIQSGDGLAVYMTSMVTNSGSGGTESVLIVNDGVHKPWVGTNLTSTPITGTYIDYDGMGVTWKAFGKPVVWQGALVFVLDSVNSVGRREDISWSEPGEPLTGYQQATFDNNMTLTLPGGAAPGPLFALSATNVALYYFRAQSIGAVAGPIDNLASSNTTDVVAFNIGCTTPRTIQQFGTAIYFVDALARPHRFLPGTAPEPIWKQMRNTVQAFGSNTVYNIAATAISAIEPTYNLYLVMLVDQRTFYVFDAPSGTYMGRWTVADINDGNGGVLIDSIGILEGIDGNQPVLFMLGPAGPTTSTRGFGWFFRARGTGVDVDQWVDGSNYPNVQVTTDRMGEDPETVYKTDRVIALVGNAGACAIAVETSNHAFSALGVSPTSTPAGSPADGTYRAVVGSEQQGRGPAVRVWPQPAVAHLPQWAIHRVTVEAVPSRANPDET